MKEKAKKILCIYACAAIAVLGACAGYCHARLRDFRLAARYSAARAFEETVGAVDNLSMSLRKSLYATDSAMCCRICSDVYADARAAETALSTLPFSTVELAELSGFLGVAGDYAYSLCSSAAAEGFSEEQTAALTEMSAAAAELAGQLGELRGSINDGTITMDSREVRLANVGEEAQTIKLSRRLNEYAGSFAAPKGLAYDGRYTAKEQEKAETVSDDELRELAADFLGVGSKQLDLKYEYSGDCCRRCYACRGQEVCVCPHGVVSMGTDRLVDEAKIGMDEAQRAAGDFLSAHGFEDLQLESSEQNGALGNFVYAQVMGDALCLRKTVQVSVALDDGSIHALNAERYDPSPDADFPGGDVTTSVRKPEGLTLTDVRPVIIESPGGHDLPCWEMGYTAGDGSEVTVFVDAETGLQQEIRV